MQILSGGEKHTGKDLLPNPFSGTLLFCRSEADETGPIPHSDQLAGTGSSLGAGAAGSSQRSGLSEAQRHSASAGGIVAAHPQYGKDERRAGRSGYFGSGYLRGGGKAGVPRSRTERGQS